MPADQEEYNTCLQFLYSLRVHGTKLGLNNIRCLLRLLDHPERGIRFYHVGGTNGKGSVAALLQALLRTTRPRVGLFTSPHLEDFRERIRIDNRRIAPGAVISGLGRIRPFLEEVRRSRGCLHPTYFEVVTALACWYFHKQEVDTVVWEVGLGGRLDATNAVLPQVAVITNVSLDHLAYLGKKLRAIAREKAGIIKPGVPLVTAETRPVALGVLKSACARKGSVLIEVEKGYRVVERGRRGRGQILDIESPRRLYRKIFLPLLGEHQARNFLTALAAWEAGEGTAASVPLRAVRRAVARVRWPGLFELWPGRPHFILDGAHNLEGARSLARTLNTFLGKKPLRLVLGVLADKDARGICRQLVPRAREVLVVEANSERALPAARLASLCRQAAGPGGPSVREVKSLESALGYCYHSADRDDWTCITGSLHLVGDARRCLRQRQKR